MMAGDLSGLALSMFIYVLRQCVDLCHASGMQGCQQRRQCICDICNDTSCVNNVGYGFGWPTWLLSRLRVVIYD